MKIKTIKEFMQLLDENLHHYDESRTLALLYSSSIAGLEGEVVLAVKWNIGKQTVQAVAVLPDKLTSKNLASIQDSINESMLATLDMEELPVLH